MNKLKKLNNIQLDEVLILPGRDYSDPHMGIRILIDGEDFLETVLNFERPLLEKEDRKDICQSRRWWPVGNKLPKKMLGGWGYDGDGRSPILICECGDDYCWPLEAKVTLTDTLVVWKDFSNMHRRHWPYNKFGPFYFSRKQYDEQLEKLSG